MTRYGLAFVIVRSMALAIWLIALMHADSAIWGMLRIFDTWYALQALGYLVVPTAIFMLGLVIWWTSASLAKRIAGSEPEAAVGGLSVDEAMLMRVMFSGIGIFLMCGFLSRVPMIIVSFFYTSSPDAMGQMVFRPSLEYIIQTVALFIFAIVLLFGRKAIPMLLMRMRKFD